jgi:DNA repair protein RadC
MANLKLYELKKIQTQFPKIKIKSSEDAADFIRQFYGDDLVIFESFFILLLDRSANTTSYAKISQGGIAGTVVDIKLIAKYAVEALASCVILCHNHPSGNKTPSQADREITTRAIKALELLEIKVFDHIILTEDSYTSFADEGML